MELKCSDDLKKLFLDFAYPIGSVYMTRTNNDPNELFGRTWVRNNNVYIYACSGDITDGYRGNGNITRPSSGNTGSTILTIDQIPSHTHAIKSGYGGEDNIAYDSYRYQYWGHHSNEWKSGDLGTGANGGGKGHTHTLGDHTHTIPWIGVHFWYRTA